MRWLSCCCLVLVLPFPVAGGGATGPRVGIRFTDSVLSQRFSGRLFVAASRQPIKEGVFRQGWFTPEPFFAQDVKDWKPGEEMLFQPTHHFPERWTKLAPGKYYLQAVMDRDLGGQSPFASPGNAYSKAVLLDWSGTRDQAISLTIDRVVEPRKFVEKERVKLVEIESKRLSEFYKRPTKLRAGVVLPRSFAEHPERRYPAVYEIPGFGGDHHLAFAAETRNATDVAGVEMLWVVLDPACRTGHHVFADSENNGPVGQALLEELIPFIEKTHRGVGKPAGRFVTGHSSGGWSSLWLQITYPDFFGGVWSTAPDPVDFRDFQKVNIYQTGTNLFRDEKGELRPLSRKTSRGRLQYQSFSDMENVFGRGGQLGSFEAVFSPKGKDGPMKLWDRKTGSVDASVAKSWERYDIRLVLERDWARLGPKLTGKIHVYMGAEDTFYLEGATRLLQESLARLGSDAVVEIFPGKDHSNLLDAKLRQRIAREMAETWSRK